MTIRTDEARFTDEQYRQELQDYRAFVEIKEIYRKCGMNERLATAAADAQLLGRQDLIKKCFELQAQDTKPVKKQGNERDLQNDDDKNNDFLLGFSGNVTPEPTRQPKVQPALDDDIDPFLKGFYEYAK